MYAVGVCKAWVPLCAHTHTQTHYTRTHGIVTRAHVMQSVGTTHIIYAKVDEITADETTCFLRVQRYIIIILPTCCVKIILKLYCNH